MVSDGRHTTPGEMPVSVIVPTYNRARLLEKTLASLERQTLRRESIDVVVVDDGSSDATKEVVTSFERTLPLKYVYQPDLGFRVARARNLGIKLAEGDVCVFVDSGVVLDAGCLAAHARAHEESRERLAVIGYVLGFSQDAENAVDLHELVARHGEEGIFAELARHPEYGDPREEVYRACGDDIGTLPAPWVLYWTCNVSVARSSLVEVGGFDENYRSWGCEDVDLGLSLFRAGVRFALSRVALALHYPHPKSREANVRSSTANRQYLHSKYGMRATELLLTERCVNVNGMLACEIAATRA
jgi:glycosyltransferase involved in cell wall biosynthesis